jgi:biotin operon repressor
MKKLTEEQFHTLWITYAKESKTREDLRQALGLTDVRPLDTRRDRLAAKGYEFPPLTRSPKRKPQAPDQSTLEDQFKVLLKRGNLTDVELAQKLGITRGAVIDLCDSLKNQGYNVHQFGDRLELSKEPAPATVTDHHIYTSHPGGYYRFGFTTDNHLCSKYAREDILEDLYNWFAASEVDCVFNAGNRIDGEARFNKHDIFVHGTQNQVN